MHVTIDSNLNKFRRLYIFEKISHRQVPTVPFRIISLADGTYVPAVRRQWKNTFLRCELALPSCAVPIFFGGEGFGNNGE